VNNLNWVGRRASRGDGRRSGGRWLFAAWLLVVVVLALSGLYFYAQGKLHFQTPRAWYFEYLAILAALVLLSLRWRWLAVPLLMLAGAEIVLGIGTGFMFRAGLVHDSLLPPDEDLLAPMAWHPLLQGVPKPSSSGTGEFAGIHHNSMGMRGEERSAKSLGDRAVLEVFGGTSVYDGWASDDQMWTAALEKILGTEYVVLNRGVGAYSTVENIIQTAFYETPYGETPRCAIYNIGWGDLSSVGSTNLDPGYADYHSRFLVDGLRTRRLSGPWIFTSPVFYLLAKEIVRAVDTARPVEERTAAIADDRISPAFEANYVRNIHTISAINRHRGIETVWLGQSINIASGGSRNRVWTIMQKLNAIVEREAGVLGDKYIDSQSTKLDAADFIDAVHFSPRGSKKFAELIAPDVLADCHK
jgi:hypothetical protein